MSTGSSGTITWTTSSWLGPDHAVRDNRGRLPRALERRALGIRDRPRAACIAVAGDEDRLGLGGDPAHLGADLLPQREAGRADALQTAGDGDPLVLEPELAAEVDRHPGEDVVPLVPDPGEDDREPLVPALPQVPP